MGITLGTTVALLVGQTAMAQQMSEVAVAPAPTPQADAMATEPSPIAPLPPVDMAAPIETLEDAWQIALRNDQRLEASRWEVTSSQSTRAAASAERLPSLKFGSDYYMLSDQPMFSTTVLGYSVEMPLADRSSVGYQALVSQPIYTFGRISSGIDAATEGVRANQANFAKTRLDIKMNVAEIYVLTLRAGRIVQVAESKAVSLESHTRDVKGFFDKGLVAKNDLLAAEVALADARQQAMQTHNMQRVAFAAYNRALQRRLDEPVHLAELQAANLPGDVDDLTRDAMQYRPEIAALAAQARAMRDQAKGERAKNAPQVAMVGGYVFQQNQYLDPDGIAMLGVGVEWTPVDCGRVSNRAAAMDEKAEALIRLRRDAESMIALDVRQKWLDLHTALERVEVTRKATAQADENVRVARDRYQQQVGTNTEVLDAETLRVQTYTNFYNSMYESMLAELRLRRAVGTL